MNRNILSTIEELESIDWFGNIGQLIDSSDVRAFPNIELALEAYRSPSWAGFKLMLRNRNFRDVAKNDYPGFKLWDSLAREALPRVESVIMNAQTSLRKHKGFTGNDINALRVDIWALVFELTYRDSCTTAPWRTRLLPVLKSGHLPCGWAGIEIDENWAGASDASLPQGNIYAF